ncbi:hypothetical protein Cgig2_018272 [Carnegiea gigantea]|uniref:Uncharacterized protein n=1 Tax=Carnegiea gigantea TaxID=171969 RepID=A0A9Q1KZA2_9CARY|nr:hypothetical protein Cgig2_018272 [Carnegiea gigantea]
MASFCARARRTLQASDVSAARNAVSKLCTSKSSGRQGRASDLLGFVASTKQSSAPRFSLQKLFNSSRLPLALGCADSLMPLHSATASALFTSMLSLHSQRWGCLSEGKFLLFIIVKVTIMETAFCVSVVSNSHGTAGAGFCTLEEMKNIEKFIPDFIDMGHGMLVDLLPLYSMVFNLVAISDMLDFAFPLLL